MPISRQERITRKAISPLFAINTFFIIFLLIITGVNFAGIETVLDGFQAVMAQAIGIILH
ncbi:MAG: hypothetical protein BHV80_02910 [Phocaeicola vulgatus]|uniref:Uncharacterized protein n=1 Tax=Phocaeicola vulgatus TaxID=821 RepID=A0A1Q6JLX7_PHOVU|nr:MAG: hypothetical protein BHV80_02910 [Phocaeicola vulgatus]